MKNILRKIYVIGFACVAFLMSGCAELFDCVASARPNLHSKTLVTGSVGTNYSDFIEADVTNEPNDNNYDYYFSVDGNLPPGMTYREQNRKIVFSGIPTQSGSFSFRVTLTVDPYDDYIVGGGGLWEDGNHICFGDDTTKKEFTIVIQ